MTRAFWLIAFLSCAWQDFAATFIVTTTADVGPGSLREAIGLANTSPGPDQIDFNIAPGHVVHVIQPGSGLPAITGPVMIDGLTQPGTLPNSLPEGFNATNLVTLDGTLLGSGLPPGGGIGDPPGGGAVTNAVHGLELLADHITIRGLRLVNFVAGGNATNMRSAIFIANARSNVVEACVLGTDASTSIGAPNYAGITATNCAFLRIGGTNANQRNLMASNPGWQMRFLDGVSNAVEGNFVGLAGLVPAAFIANGPGTVFERGHGNRVGGIEPGARNFFGGVGAAILHDLRGAVHFRESHTNEVFGNWFGLQPSEVRCQLPGGAQPCGLGVAGVSQGVLIEDSRENQIGGAASGAANVIDAGASGVEITGANSFNNRVQGNRVGTHPSGTAAGTQSLNPNSGNVTGVRITAGAHLNLVGGSAPGEGNLIANNTQHGVAMAGTNTTANRVLGNFIGTDLTGTNALPNGTFGQSATAGIAVSQSASGNFIGGAAAGERNLISGNFGDGTLLTGSGTDANQIRGNWIGPDASGIRRPVLRGFPGLEELGNGAHGVRITDGASRNLIGGRLAGEGNVISGNGENGVLIEEPAALRPTRENQLLGNRIGTQPNGAAALANARSGVRIQASGNFIGGTFGGAGNVISGNLQSGVVLLGHLNQVQGSFIGTDATGLQSIANQDGGVRVEGSTNQVGGLELAARNFISGNIGHGVLILGDAAVHNQIAANFIGLSATGAALGNNGDGVRLTGNARFNRVGGSLPSAANVISGNLLHGVLIQATPTVTFPTSANEVLGNRIGTDSAGTSARPNGGDGVSVIASRSNAISANLISGNTGHGIFASGAPDTLIQANMIGADVSGAKPAGNSGEGIYLLDSNGTRVGDTADPQLGNRIAFNLLNGVLVEGLGRSNSICGNSIEANGSLGINLQPGFELDNTVTPNDPLDADSGPNALQNYPVITSALAASDTTLNGMLRATPGRAFAVEVFRSAAADPSGHGEGAVFMTRVEVSTDANGNAPFTSNLSGSFVGQFFTATATDRSSGDTSEFGPAVLAVPPLSFTFARRANDGFEAGFQSVNGLGYSVLTNADLGTTNWALLTNLVGNGATQSFRVPVGSAAHLFFRLRQP